MSESTLLARRAVIRDIVDRNREGQCLHERNIRMDVPALFDRAVDCFGSWRLALTQAGLRHPNVESYANSDIGQVLRAIRYICHRGSSVRTQDVRDNRTSLYQAALRHFGSWRQALEAAGINTTQMNSHSVWGRDRIIEGILLRAVERRPLASTKVRPLSLKTAAVREFGSWALALQAAGLDPTEYMWRRPKNCRDEPSGRKWNSIRVIKLIRQREVLGMPLDKNAVSRDNRPLVRAARAYFGDWTLAVEAAFTDQTDTTST